MITLSLILTFILLWTLLAAACVKIEHLQERERLNHTRSHAVCIMAVTEAVTEAVSQSHDAALLRRLADTWDSPDEQGILRVLAREQYSPGGPSMPALWLRQQAELIEPESRLCDL